MAGYYLPLIKDTTCTVWMITSLIGYTREHSRYNGIGFSP